LTAEDAVAVALWNNAALQADLSALGFARADLLEAGLLKNPTFSLLFPLGPKQLEFTLGLPAEVLWQRPKRVAMAKLNAESIANGLVRNGLLLAGAVRIAHAEGLFAERSASLRKELAELDSEISGISQARLRAGDISELEAIGIRARSLRSEENARRAESEVIVAEARLRNLLGLGDAKVAMKLTPSALPVPSKIDVANLLKEAFAARPDLRAAELQMEAAGKRAGWEKAKVVQLSVLLDANGQGREGFEAGPGLNLPLPFFDWNQSGMARARAEMEQAAFRYVEVQQRIVLEVRENHARFESAREALELWRVKAMPALEERRIGAVKSYEAGEVSYLYVLESKREWLDAQAHDAELEAELLRAVARLEQAAGKKLP
jgi:cobalt-zinc-cadmium efflux system outer membrane protein